MKILCIKGGLGNQLFEYCRYLSILEKKKEKVFLFFDYRQLKQHKYYMITDCFDIKLPKPPFYIDLLVYGIKLFRTIHLFPELYDDERTDCILIDDYCQDKKYLTNTQQFIKFRQLDLSNYDKECLAMIQASSFPVSVHIRRGDYLQNDNLENIGLCSISYYKSSIQAIKEQHPETTFFFFSDDIEWTKQNLPTSNAVYITRQETPDYVDLYLMTKCKSHIIANSTFSYWGSKLADNDDHLCYYPAKWFINPEWNTPDIFPKHWISI